MDHFLTHQCLAACQRMSMKSCWDNSKSVDHSIARSRDLPTPLSLIFNEKRVIYNQHPRWSWMHEQSHHLSQILPVYKHVAPISGQPHIRLPSVHQTALTLATFNIYWAIQIFLWPWDAVALSRAGQEMQWLIWERYRQHNDMPITTNGL